MWLERNAQHDAWRGSIHDVASGRKFYVTGPGEVAEFITVHLNERDASKET
jgi:hypothetical protein